MPAGRVLMVLHDYYPEETRVVAEAAAALAAGFSVDILALRGRGEAAAELVDGVRVIRLPVSHRHGAGAPALVGEYLRFAALASVQAARRTLRARYDVIHVHNPPDFLVLAALLPRLAGSGVVLDVHDLTPDMFAMRFGDRGVAERGLRLLERWSARAADVVLTVHEPYRAELTAHGVPGGKIVVLMNSLDERLLPSEPRSAARNGAFRVVYHGTLTPHYGVELLVEAAALARPSVPGLRLEIYGTGDALPAVRERAHALGLDDVLTLVPRFLPQAEVLTAVRDASVGAACNLPTRLNRFALPTKLLEYVALGIPAVAPGLPTIREHFSADEIELFEPGDARSLAGALERVAADPAGAATRAEAARRRYEAYRWEHSARAYADVLNRLSARPRRRRKAGAELELGPRDGGYS